MQVVEVNWQMLDIEEPRSGGFIFSCVNGSFEVLK